MDRTCILYVNTPSYLAKSKPCQWRFWNEFNNTSLTKNIHCDVKYIYSKKVVVSKNYKSVDEGMFCMANFNDNAHHVW